MSDPLISPMEQLRRALRDVLPQASDEQISTVADKILQVAHPVFTPERMREARAQG